MGPKARGLSKHWLFCSGRNVKYESTNLFIESAPLKQISRYKFELKMNLARGANMPVVFKSKLAPSSVPSNKQGVNEEMKDKVYSYIYKYQYGNNLWAYVTPPFIDKISITLSVQCDQQRLTIKSGLINAIKEPKSGFLDIKERHGYKLAATYSPPNSMASILIQLEPIKGNKASHYVRLEFNPHKIEPTGLYLFKEKIQQQTIGALEWWMFVKSGFATRVDAAVDILNAPAHELAWQSIVLGKAHIYIGENGDLQTAYLGLLKPGKASNQLFYNKTIQELEQGYIPDFPGDRTRIEMIKKGASQKLKTIDSFENLMKRISVVHPGASPENIDDLIWSLFLDNCRLQGIPNALNELPSSIRIPCESTMQARAKLTWRPDKIWMHWPNAVKQSGLLENGPPSLYPQHTV
jgi:hypothetical protein